MIELYRRLICLVIGHYWINLDTENYRADCSRCGDSFNVSYDMCYGETYSTGRIKK